MAKKQRRKKPARTGKATKKVVGEFSSSKRKYTRRKVKGVTELKRWKNGVNKGQIKSVSMVIYNTRKSLEAFADDIQNDKDFRKKLDRIYYRNRENGVTRLPYAANVIVEQRNRKNPSEFHYESYFMEPPATKENIRRHTVNTVRNHGEFIRRRLVKLGFTSVKYDFSNFKPWHVPSVRIELLYE